MWGGVDKICRVKNSWSANLSMGGRGLVEIGLFRGSSGSQNIGKRGKDAEQIIQHTRASSIELHEPSNKSSSINCKIRDGMQSDVAVAIIIKRAIP